MLRPQPIKHMRLLVLTEDLPRVSLGLAELGSFQPDPRPLYESELPHLPGRGYREIYQQSRARLEKITKLIAFTEEAVIEAIRVVEEPELATLNDWLGGLWQQCSSYEEEFRRLADEERLIREQQIALANFTNLNVNLGALRTTTRFLDFYVGIVPREHLRQLEGAVGLAEHLLFNYLQSEGHAHVVIVGPRGVKEAQLTAVLNAAGFQALPIPPGMAREPEELGVELTERLSQIQQTRGSLETRLAAWGEGFRTPLLAARQTLMLAEPFVSLDPSIRALGNLAFVAGWVPARAVGEIERRLRQDLQQPFQLETRDPLPEERPLVPSLITKGRLLAPFATLVKQYGVPKYGEVDPTPLFAITFLLMFGMMFGDVGHGAVIALSAWLLRGKLGRFTWFGMAAGASSIAFGFLFGSLFGYEDVIEAWWMSPLQDPILMLKVALGWGIGFILVACLLGITNRLLAGNRAEAIFGHHGVINLVFYLAFLAEGYQIARTGNFGQVPALLVVGSLVTLALYQWRHISGPTGERVLIVVIETLDTVIVYLSNTLSFLRVSAFSLNHVALSSAIFTLAGLMGTTGHWITVLLGNLFILILEGGIVMIQVMRLEFYEGFSRYFSGDGHEFAPLRLRRALRSEA